MKTVATLGCAAAVLSLCASAWPAVLNVPGQYPTIQAGINAAAIGDTVLVAPGTYIGNGNRDLQFSSSLPAKDITVMSSGGPWVTTIDCQGSSSSPHRGFVFQCCESSNSVVQGFTIQNGWALEGGAIYCLSSSPTITGNVIRANTGQDFGGGIRCASQSSPTITNNFILGNQSNAGGGICCYWYCIPTITGNLIEGNVSAGVGGGIEVYDGGPWQGPLISGNTIRGNSSGGGGGGIGLSNSYATIIGNRIEANVAQSGGGGGILCGISSSPIIDLNTIVGNSSGSWPGGGVYCHWQASPTIDINTFSGNSACYGGAIGCDMQCSPAVTNCILWADVASAPQEIYVGPIGCTITVDYSDVQGSWPGTGNINSDPKFVLPGQGDYRLLWGSPCIDAGDPTWPSDPDGTRCDMGAHPFDQSRQLTLYLSPHASHVSPGGQLGVTYTVINRQAQPVSFTVSSEGVLPNGNTVNVLGPTTYTLPANFTAQRLFSHHVPGAAPVGNYLYRSKVTPPGSPNPYDQDQFAFLIP
jgi:hypothetical protein